MARLRYKIMVLCLSVLLLGACQYVKPIGIPSTTWVPLPTIAPPATEAPPPMTAVPTLAEIATPTPLAKPTARATEVPQEVPPEPSQERAIWARDLAWQYLWKSEQLKDDMRLPEWVQAKREEVLGGTHFVYEAQGWQVNVAVPSDAASSGYAVDVSGPDGLLWEGLVQADGAISVPADVVVEATAQASPTPEVVTAWLGTLHKLPSGSQYDDYFQVIGDRGGQYGIASSDANVSQQLDELGDSGQIVRVSGILERPADDHGETQIRVSSLGIVPPPPTAQPASELVEGWVGVIRLLPAGSLFDDYFDGQQPAVQWGIEGVLAPVSAELDAYRDAGVLVRIWGVLEYVDDDYGQRRISVLRVEAVP